MLSRLAYLSLCRSTQLLALLARSDPARDLELMVLRHQLNVLRRQVPRPRLEPTDRARLAAISRVLRDPAGRASWSRSCRWHSPWQPDICRSVVSSERRDARFATPQG